jgi:hypothetical protein
MNRLRQLGTIAALILLIAAAGCGGGGGGGTEPGTAPAAPTNLIATANSPISVTLQWIDESTDEDGFKIEQQAPGGWMQIAQLGTDVTTTTITGLAPNTPYAFRARAYNADGNSAYSNTANVTTPPEEAVPAAPTGLEATAESSTSIRLSWTDASGDESGFRIEVQMEGGWTTAGEVVANTTSFLHTQLIPDTPYSYRVYAYNGSGNSGTSNTASARTLSEVMASIAAGTASGVPGMTVSVPIAITTTLTTLTGYGISLQFDASKLELIDVRQERLGLPMFQFASPEAGKVAFAATAVSPVAVSNGTIATVRFRIRDGASGIAVVRPTQAELSDAEFRPLTVTGLGEGSVQIGP